MSKLCHQPKKEKPGSILYLSLNLILFSPNHAPSLVSSNQYCIYNMGELGGKLSMNKNKLRSGKWKKNFIKYGLCYFWVLEISRMCVRGKERQTERAVMCKIKPYKLQLSTLPKAVSMGTVAFDGHKTPGRWGFFTFSNSSTIRNVTQLQFLSGRAKIRASALSSHGAACSLSPWTLPVGHRSLKAGSKVPRPAAFHQPLQ